MEESRRAMAPSSHRHCRCPTRALTFPSPPRKFTGPGLDGYEPSKVDYSQSDKVTGSCNRQRRSQAPLLTGPCLCNAASSPCLRTAASSPCLRTAASSPHRPPWPLNLPSQWRKILAQRCAEIVGEVGETELLSKHQDSWRLAVAACNVDVTSRCRGRRKPALQDQTCHGAVLVSQGSSSVAPATAARTGCCTSLGSWAAGLRRAQRRKSCER